MGKRILFVLGVLIFLVAIPLQAAVPKYGNTVLVSVPINDDAYLAGGKVIVNEEIGGDAVLAGGSLHVYAPVVQDLIMAGGVLNVEGAVGDDLRAAGGEISISGPVADDLIAAGGSVTTGRDTRVGGDMMIAGGNVTLGGAVRGNSKIAAGELTINGTMGGRTRFSASKVSLGPQARFLDDVEYWTEAGELDFGSSLIAGKATFNPELDFPGKGPALLKGRGKKIGSVILGAWLVFSILSGGLIILVLVLLTEKYFDLAFHRLQASFWKSFGLGFLYFVVTPIAAGLLTITVIGIPLGLLTLFLYFFSLYFAGIITAMVLAKWIEWRRRSDWGKAAFFLASFGLFILLKLLILIPFVGWLAGAVFICAAFGASIMTDWELFRRVC